MKEESSQFLQRVGSLGEYWVGATNYTMKLPLAKPSAYLILLILSYALGYFSARSSLNYTANNNLHLRDTITTATSSSQSQKRITSSSIQQQQRHNQFSTQCVDPIPYNLIRQTILSKIFSGTSPFTNFPPPHIPTLIQPVRLKGWGSHTPVFENLIRQTRPKTIIEVGTFLGASAIHMANLTRQLGLDTQILCLDDFRGWAGFRTGSLADIPMVNGDLQLLYQFMQNVVYMNFTGLIIPVPFSTASSLDRFCQWGVFGDLVEVDAGHDFHSAWSDINLAYKLVRRPGGVLFGHDYFNRYDNRGVRRAVNLFAKVNGLKVGVDGQHWVIGPL